MIDWKTAQVRLGVVADGVPGPKTYAALFARCAGREVDATIAAIGAAAPAVLAAREIDARPMRLANFVAQTCNETGGYTAFEENLHYSAATLLRLWPKHFTPAQAAAAVGNPVEIASRAYGGRMGNAPYPSKDGYTYRGRGMLQLTGKAQYAARSARVGIDLVANPDRAADPATSLLIASDFWAAGNVNAALDAGDLTHARAITNGGAIGLDHVNQLHAAMMRILA